MLESVGIVTFAGPPAATCPDQITLFVEHDLDLTGGWIRIVNDHSTSTSHVSVGRSQRRLRTECGGEEDWGEEEEGFHGGL